MPVQEDLGELKMQEPEISKGRRFHTVFLTTPLMISSITTFIFKKELQEDLLFCSFYVLFICSVKETIIIINVMLKTDTHIVYDTQRDQWF